MNGAEVLLKTLKEAGVDTIFGYPGGAVIPLYDALYRDGGFKHIRTAHEQGAVHAADGYARSSGKVGVSFVTSGPGATNTVTGLATAYLDSVPLLVISGQVNRELLGKDSFQEIDIVGVTFSITKHSYSLREVNSIPQVIKKALAIAQSGRPGPVLVDIPKDVFLAAYEPQLEVESSSLGQRKTSKSTEVAKLAALIEGAQRPVIYAGGGVRIAGAARELVALAERAEVPVVNTLMSLGTIPGDHELALGLVGMHGSKAGNLAVTNCDLLLGIGARFSDRVIGDPQKFASGAKIVQIDIDSSEMEKNIPADLTLLGDIRVILEELSKSIGPQDHKPWLKEIQGWRKANKATGEFTPANILKSFNEVLGANPIVVTDVGQHQIWVAQHWNFQQPNQFITSGGLGTMGFGLGAALGAQIANPNKPVLLVTGDGSFRMNCHELFTVGRYGLPLIVLLLNNSTLGMVRQWQRIFFAGRYAETDLDESFDYVKLVEGYGLAAFRADSLAELQDLLASLELGQGPLFIECRIDKDESVFPMVPPGKSLDALLFEG